MKKVLTFVQGFVTSIAVSGLMILGIKEYCKYLKQVYELGTELGEKLGNKIANLFHREKKRKFFTSKTKVRSSYVN